MIFENLRKISANFQKSFVTVGLGIINRLLIGLARAVPGFTSPWSFHTALASSRCMKDLGLVNPGMVLAPG